MVIRTTAGDGCWLDGRGGLVLGVAMSSNSGTHGEPLLAWEISGAVYARGDGSDGAWLLRGQVVVDSPKRDVRFPGGQWGRFEADEKKPRRKAWH